MNVITGSVSVAQPRSTVYSEFADPSNWKRLAATFGDMQLLMSETNRHITLMKSGHGLFNPTIVTLREFIPEERILFFHIVPAFPIRTHSGEWSFISEDPGHTRIQVTHRFDCYFGPLGRFLESVVVGPLVIRPHTLAMLRQVKSVIETAHE